MHITNEIDNVLHETKQLSNSNSVFIEYFPKSIFDFMKNKLSPQFLLKFWCNNSYTYLGKCGSLFWSKIYTDV